MLAPKEDPSAPRAGKPVRPGWGVDAEPPMLPLRGAMREGVQPFPATLHECPRRRAHLRVRRNNNKIMTPNAHPGHGSHAGRSLPVPPAGSLLLRGSFGGEGPTRPAVGREGGREGRNRLIKRIH